MINLETRGESVGVEVAHESESRSEIARRRKDAHAARVLRGRVCGPPIHHHARNALM